MQQLGCRLMKNKILCIVTVVIFMPSYGQIYEYIDPSGNKIYTDRQPFFSNSDASASHNTKDSASERNSNNIPKDHLTDAAEH
jgi:hypothetical protein